MIKNTQRNHKFTSKQIQLIIGGMSCQACATRIEKVLNKKSAISQASVNFAGETANVTFDPSLTNVDEIVSWVEKAGFEAYVGQPQAIFNHDKVLDEDRITADKWLLLAIWLCLLPFLVGMLGMMMGSHAFMPPTWIQFLLATFVQFVLAVPFYKSAWASIKGGVANMDVLVILGTLTIWTYSTYVWLVHAGGVGQAHVYFESSVMIIAFVRLGKFLEERTKKHSLNSIGLLTQLVPNDILVKNEHSEWQNIKLEQLTIGQVVLAKQGSRIACDGVVVSGEGWCDESHLTGESIPLQKTVGDKVLAGAMVSNGGFEYKAMALGQATQLGDMIQALSDAQGSKANLARLADKIASIFVPTVVSISIITFIINYLLLGELNEAVVRAVSVLVIACPCALGLATPAAIMAGMGVSARHGIWFKDAKSLEATGSIDTVVLDKTGTLTQGKPIVAKHFLVDNRLNIDDVLALVASVELHANHPLATALVNHAKQRNIKLLPSHAITQIKTVVGQGIQANIQGFGLVKVGTMEFTNLTLPERLLTNTLSTSNSLTDDFLADTLLTDNPLNGKQADNDNSKDNTTDDKNIWQIASIVAVSINDIPLGAFALADSLKEDSRQLVQRLQKQGLEVIIMSGDKNSVVQYIANQVNIKRYFGQLCPRDKAEKIDQLQQQGKHIVMVGDGVNDAPAMATATASFAVYQGTDIAQHSASARLMGESLSHIDNAQYIAKATVRNIKQNLFFAFIYNGLGIPLAAMGFLNPMIAAAAMAMSSISVLFNALRLNRLKMYSTDLTAPKKDTYEKS